MNLLSAFTEAESRSFLSCLHSQRNVTLTSHIGGVAQETLSEFERLCLTNIDHFLRTNEPLLTKV